MNSKITIVHMKLAYFETICSINSDMKYQTNDWKRQTEILNTSDNHRYADARRDRMHSRVYEI